VPIIIFPWSERAAQEEKHKTKFFSLVRRQNRSDGEKSATVPENAYNSD